MTNQPSNDSSVRTLLPLTTAPGVKSGVVV